MPMYNNYGYYPQQNYQPQFQLPSQQQSQTMQIQNGGFIPAPNENYARNYPVAPGNSVTFKDENAPYVYTKTMGFSQLDRPIFEKFRLVKEDVAESVSNAQNQTQTQDTIDLSDYVQKDEFEAFKNEFNAFKKEISNESNKSTPGTSKKPNAVSDAKTSQRPPKHNG